MQEDAGSVENVNAVAVADAEKIDRTDVPAVDSVAAEETGVGEEKAEAPKKKQRPKKKAKVPTVDEIVASEEAGNAVDAEDSGEVKESAEVKEESVDSAETAEKGSAEGDENEASDDGELFERRPQLNIDSETALLETVLFLESEPQSPEALSKITRLDTETVMRCIDRLREKYSDLDSGIELSQIVGGWILTPKKECFDLVKERYGKKNEGRLSKAAIETLSIIAYSQPITRAEIESIRHVSADNMMKILLDRKFIKEFGKKDIPGKPVMYVTTNEFLEFFHLQSIADLPQLDEKESERFELAR